MRHYQLPRRIYLVAALFLLLLASGCSQPIGSVSGEVTLDGKPLKNGYVTFTPADGKGPIVGGEVANGHFDVPRVPLGSKIVSVAATAPATSEEISSEEANAKAAKAAKAAATPNVTSVTGNGQTLDVVAGPQAFNVTLTSARR